MPCREVEVHGGCKDDFRGLLRVRRTTYYSCPGVGRAYTTGVWILTDI